MGMDVTELPHIYMESLSTVASLVTELHLQTFVKVEA